MTILIVGSGGREHALLWKLRRDAPNADFFITRGNGGTHGLATALPLDPGDRDALVAWADDDSADLTVVGPEAPLAAGLADAFRRKGLPIFGPSRGAAAIEASKAYAKGLMRRAGVPTAAFATFGDLGQARAHIRAHGAPCVVKASGLAAGKGAVVCHSEDDALDAARAMLADGTFGEAGREIVVEELLEGEELSVFALTDGETAVPLLPSQDYKRVAEGDAGPNTGGMGAYAPVSRVDDALLERVRREILRPTLSALRADGRPFRGLLYAGLMLTDEGPAVVEFNARFGDPETQALLPLLHSSLLEPMLRVARGEPLGSPAFEWRGGCALATVLASGGYPGAYETGKEIRVPEWIGDADDLIVFHAGTRREDGRLLTDGGRVLAAVALADEFGTAAERSRAAAEAISFAGRQYRSDIGWRERERCARTA